ncbi:MAG: tRNA (adenosine(37)-N6)-threonylcarbamoyltransferase complex dimerization subunit type 1 TsaB [candidate division WOR-3 bacterium]
MTGAFLGLETSGRTTGLALVKDKMVVWEKRTPNDVSHNESLLPLIDTAFAQTEIKLNELTGICLTIGPGMFTSLRVGLSVTKGLAVARGLLVKGINTLRALSFTAETERGNQLVLSLIDARKGEVYAGLYQGGEAIIAPKVVTPEGLARLLGQTNLSSNSLVIAGDGAELAEPVLKKAGYHIDRIGITFPSPVAVIRLGIDLLLKEGGDDITKLEPTYLRRTDAELKREPRQSDS